MQVELIKARTADGVTLDGALRRPVDGMVNDYPFGVVIMHHGVGGNFYTANFFDDLADRFLAKGSAVIRANNRGHDLAYNAAPPHNRLGAAFEILDDCRADWFAWLDSANEHGFERACLWAHSLGAVKNIYFLAREKDSRISHALASSPPCFSQSTFLARANGYLFETAMQEAKRLEDNGRTDIIFPIEVPTVAMMTAGTFFDKYGADERYNILNLLPDIETPLFLTLGGLEGVQTDHPSAFAFEGMADRLSELAEGKNNTTFKLIEDADHFYRGQSESLWLAAQNWFS